MPEYTVCGHNSATLRESLLENAFKLAEQYVEAAREHFSPGIIGPFCLQTCVDKDLKFYIYDVAPRIGGGTNVHMNVGHAYGNSLWRKNMSTGRAAGDGSAPGAGRGPAEGDRDLSWRFVDSDLISPATASAVDEAILAARAEGSVPDTFHLYRRNSPSISLGHFERVAESVDLEAAKRLGVAFGPPDVRGQRRVHRPGTT